ncbi:hypothetical protein MLD38_028746 [Melastoma candidum]|uniref:Uncharacterized protein n=1 Tax=Melastoma candidum TaxID=119954 RepID=A0ACB9N2I1_9MYRT|nr:hypothetical protein MLD38_028746 [Melastoma candidum]
MDAVKSFKGYGKVDELEQRQFAAKTRRRLLFLAFLALLFLGIVAAVIATVVHVRSRGRGDDDSPGSSPSSELTPASSLLAVCGVTRYPDSCFSSISSLNSDNSTDPEQLFLLSLRVAADELRKVSDLPSRLSAQAGVTIDRGVRAALANVCLPLLQDAAETITESISSLNSTSRVGKLLLNSSAIADIRTQLSAALTDQETCIDSLTEFNATALADLVRSGTMNATRFTSNSLAIATRIISLLAQLNLPINRRRLLTEGNRGPSDFPEWVGSRERRMLAGEVTPDVTVAKDGSGNYKSISEAVAAAPVKNGTGRFVIYVKAGNYTEKVNIGKNVWNVMMYGDGKTQTVVSGSLNFIDGTPTFQTASFGQSNLDFLSFGSEHE